MSGIFIAGTGMYVPPKVVTNNDMSQIVETSDEWIYGRTGIKERHFSQGETTFYMGSEAAKEAVKKAEINVEDIDLIIGCTFTSDYLFPSFSCQLQDELGAENAFCWDLNAACSGFIYALDIAQTYLASGKLKNILIVCSETLSKVVDFTDRSTCVLFGDAAAAVVVQASDGLYHSYLRSEGKGGVSLVAGGIKNHSPFTTDESNEEYAKFKNINDQYLRMDGREVYRFATRAMTEAVEIACEKAGVNVRELDLVIPHQANIRIIKTAADRLGIDMDKMYVNVDKYGNTSCVSIPICLEELNAAGRLHKGDKIALAGFGAGLTYGAIVMEW